MTDPVQKVHMLKGVVKQSLLKLTSRLLSIRMTLFDSRHMALDFVEQYRQLATPTERVGMLQEHYEVLARRRIVAEEVSATIFGHQAMGEAKRDGDGYAISVMGDSEMHGYLTYHEAMHIWLEETGRTIDIQNENPNFRELLFCVRNLVNDFLIETEVARNCGNFYGEMVLRDKDRQILSNIAGAGNASGTRLICEGLLTVALSMVYNEVENLGTVDLFTKGISHPNLQYIVDLLSGYDGVSITPEEYRKLVAKIAELLTMTSFADIDGKLVVQEPEKLQSFIDYNNDMFKDFRRALRGR